MREDVQPGASEQGATSGRDKYTGPDDRNRSDATFDRARQALKEGFEEVGGAAGQVVAVDADGDRLDGLLEPVDGLRGAADVVDEDELSAGSEDSSHLGQGLVGVEDVAQGEGADDGVEGLVGEGEVVGVALLEVDVAVGLGGAVAGDVEHRVAELTKRLAKHAPATMRVSKEAIRRILHAALPNGDDLVRECYGSDDFQVGVRAFVEKREPQWTGT